jgi:hypothetical protein
MTIKVSEDGNTVCCGRNGPRLAFQAGGVCGDCVANKRHRLCRKLPCVTIKSKTNGVYSYRNGNYQEVK